MSAKTKRRIKIAVAVSSAGFGLVVLLFSLVGTHALQGCGGGGSDCTKVCSKMARCMYTSSASSSGSGSFSASGTGSGGELTCEAECEKQVKATPKFNDMVQCMLKADDDCQPTSSTGPVNPCCLVVETCLYQASSF